MKDQEIIQGIMSGGYDMEKCLELFYREHISFMNSMGRKFGLSRESLLDAYSDSIIDFKDQVRNRLFQHKSKCSTYLYSIFKNKCIDILRKKTTNTFIHEIPEYLKDSDPDIIQKMTFSVRKEYLARLLARLDNACKDILMDWNDGFSMEEIALRNNLLNAHVARTKRYTCLQQLLTITGKGKLAEGE